MDELAMIAARLGAALKPGATAGDHLFLLHFTADSLATAAALLMLVGLAYFSLRRRDFEFRGVMWLSAVAFFAMALSYGFTAWGLLQPERWVEGALKTIAALMTTTAAIALLSSLPRAMRLPSPRQLKRVNANLTRETWEQQRQLEEAQEEASLYRKAFEHSETGLALLSPAGRWLKINQRLAELLGTTQSELLKITPAQVFGAECLQNIGQKHRELNNGRWLVWQMSSIKNGAGAEKLRLMQCQDATLTQNLELELVNVRDQLRTQSAERTNESERLSAERDEATAAKNSAKAALALEAERLEEHARHLSALGERITEIVGVDTATGLISSHQFVVRLEQALAGARRYGQSFTLLVLAADPMETGLVDDDVLRGNLGAVLRAELRETDAAGRCDTERICILLPVTHLEEAFSVTGRIRRRLAISPVLALDGRNLRITCCFGAAEWKSGQGLGEVMREAGDALRAARGGGRDRIKTGTPPAAASP